MNVVVLYASRTGNTERAAEMIGGRVRAQGADVVVRPVENFVLEELSQADLLYVGTWVDGLVLFGHRPGDTGKVLTLPMLWDKPTVAYMTYAIRPGNAIDKMAGLLEYRGAQVVGRKALHRKRLDAEVDQLVEQTLTLV